MEDEAALADLVLDYLSLAQPEYCSARCPSVGREGVPIPHLPECVSMRALLDAAPPAEAGDGWMPIETLPAEGLYLLASNAGPKHSVHHAGHFFEVWSARSYHAAMDPGATFAQRTLRGEAQAITHWRPLPAPPALAAQEPRA